MPGRVAKNTKCHGLFELPQVPRNLGRVGHVRGTCDEPMCPHTNLIEISMLFFLGAHRALHLAIQSVSKKTFYFPLIHTIYPLLLCIGERIRETLFEVPGVPSGRKGRSLSVVRSKQPLDGADQIRGDRERSTSSVGPLRGPERCSLLIFQARPLSGVWPTRAESRVEARPRNSGWTYGPTSGDKPDPRHSPSKRNPAPDPSP
jgi:hypothetical protein